jgi:hypothetical protein
MRTLALRGLQRSAAARAVSARYVNTSVVRSEKVVERKDPAGQPSLGMQAVPQTQAMKSNKNEIYDFYSLAKVFQEHGTKNKNES